MATSEPHVTVGVPGVRAKFRCVSKTVNEHQSQGGEVKLIPVMGKSPENKEFFRWTPSGELRMGTINAPAFAYFEIGRDYYIDLVKADPVDELRAALSEAKEQLASYQQYQSQHPGGSYDQSIRQAQQTIEALEADIRARATAEKNAPASA